MLLLRGGGCLVQGGRVRSLALLARPAGVVGVAQMLQQHPQSLAMMARRGLAAGKVENEGTHADFQKQSKAPPPDEEVQAWIAQAVKDHPVMLFMKGSAEAPLCGYSKFVAEELQKLDAHFSTANVLEDESIRAGLKVFSQWPTFPQLYVKGQFIGGAQIVGELVASGELKRLLEDAGAIKKD